MHSGLSAQRWLGGPSGPVQPAWLSGFSHRQVVPPHDGLSLLAAATESGLAPSMYWDDEEGTVIGLGLHDEVTASGPERFLQADRHLATRAPGRWFGGFSFEASTERGPFKDFPALYLCRPSIVWFKPAGSEHAWLCSEVEVSREFRWRRAEAWATEAPRPGSTCVGDATRLPENREDWSASVQGALSSIRDGSMSKVVVSRQIRVRASHDFEPAKVLQRLSRRHRSEAAFAIWRGNMAFLGLTPERLVKVKGDQAWTEALAGTSSEDDPRGEKLLASQKDLREQAHVLEFIKERLRGIAEDIVCDSQPSVRRLGNLAHLCTRVEARGLRGTPLSVAQALHPTPAVGGVPPSRATELIAELENDPRGWYAGGVGWLESGFQAPQAEWRVALRSALLDGSYATVFVGAGIVPGSTEASEWNETGLKARRTLAALGL